MKNVMKIAIPGLAAVVCVTLALAQDPAASRGGGKGKGGSAQLWYVEKTTGGVYKPPMRPLWKLSDLKAMLAGQSSWQAPQLICQGADSIVSSRLIDI